MTELLQMRAHGQPGQPTLIYIPGLHGDWTIIGSFRTALAERAHFIEFTYPRTTTWSVAEYAQAIERALLEHGITTGWLLAESFGSQIGWALLDPARRRPDGVLSPAAPDGTAADQTRPESGGFRPQGLILAGGFARHPWPVAVRLARRLCQALSPRLFHRLLRLYIRYATWRHPGDSTTQSDLAEFVSRRTLADREAAVHRLDLIADYNPNPIAENTTLPVYYLSGMIDPVVPWPYVRRWLRGHCPGFREAKIYWRADHHVLGTAPAAADQILQWMARHKNTPSSPDGVIH